MVSFWPFGSDGRSAAEFEKVLAALSEKINRTSAKDAKLRSTQRRLEGLWMLYTGSAYLLALLILFFVVGRNNWTTIEIAGLAGGPVVIYTVRLGIDAFYEYRISGTQTRLSELTKQRNEAIEKLKAATKYNSTQQLLDKYGGSTSKEAPKTGSQKRDRSSGAKSTDSRRHSLQRTGLPPPPTANIPGRSPITPGGHSRQSSSNQQQQQQLLSPNPDTGAEFAPNAFSPLSPNSPENPFSPIPRSTARFPPPPPHSPTVPPSAADSDEASSNRISRSWTDRLMDVILGEDEAQPRNRLALLCRNPECGLVNGLAPPGTRSLEDVGRWRCMACGAWNGVDGRRGGSKGGNAMAHTPSASVTSFGSEAERPLSAISAAEPAVNGDRNDEDDDVERDEEASSEEGATAAAGQAVPGTGSVRQRKK